MGTPTPIMGVSFTVGCSVGQPLRSVGWKRRTSLKVTPWVGAFGRLDTPNEHEPSPKVGRLVGRLGEGSAGFVR